MSHLRSHLSKCPKRVNKDIKQFLVPTDPTQGGKSSLRNYKFDNNELCKGICLYLLDRAHPFIDVEYKSFRYMMTLATPQFEPFGRLTLKRELESLHASQKQKLKEIFTNINGRICLTTDNWRSLHSREEYICVTAHFVDNDWKLQKRIISFKELEPSFDGRCVADEILLTLSEWNIQNKVLTITVDNASYNNVMITNVISRLSARKFLIRNGDFFQVRCCAHILNLIVQSGLSVIKDPLDKIRYMVKFIYKSPSRSKKLFEIAKRNFYLETTRKLKVDMPIRWNSTFKMLDNVLYYKDAIISLCGRDHDMHCYELSTSEWDTLTIIHKFLNVFYDVTCMFFAVRTPTSNVYFIGVWMIQKALLEAMQGGGERNVLIDIVKHMQSKFNKYWLEYNKVLSCAALLDPRYKERFLGYCFSKIYGKDKVRFYVAKIVDNLRALFEEYKNSDSKASDEGSLSSKKKVTSGNTSEIYSDYEMFVSETSFSLEKSQVDLYLAEPTHKLDEDVDVLDFWNKSSMRYPQLARLARDILAIPISTVASKSAFSIGGKTITSTRSSLKAKTVQMLMCLKNWFKAQDKDNVFGPDESDSSSEDDDKTDADSENDGGLSDF